MEIEQKGSLASKALRIGARVCGVAFVLGGVLVGTAIFSKPTAGLGPNILMAGFTIICFIVAAILFRVAAGKKIVEGDGAYRRRSAGASAIPEKLSSAAARKLPVPSGLERFRRSLDGGVYLWADDDERAAAGCGALFGVVWTSIIGCWIWMVMVRGGGFRFDLPHSLFMLIPIAFLVVGLVLIVQSVRGVRANGVLDGVRVSALEHPVWPGQRVELIVSLAGRAARWAAVDCELVLREVATEQAGSSTVTKDAVVLTLRPATVAEERGGDGKRRLRVAWDLPVEAVPSFASDNNKIQWAVAMNLRRSETGSPITGRWPIVVLPQEK